MRLALRILKLLAVGLAGYLVIALLQTLVLEVFLQGQTRPDAPMRILVLAGLGTVASGLIGGYSAARLGGERPLSHTLAVLAFLSLDGVYVIVENVGGNPLLFELSGAATLLLATFVGGWLCRVQRDRARRWNEVAEDPAAVG